MNEWANALDAGAQCIALRRNPRARRAGPQRAALPVRRQRDRRLPGARRSTSGVEFLGRALRGHRARAPRGWAEKVERGPGRRAGSRRRSARSPRSSRARRACGSALKLHDGTDPAELDVTGIVCGTGFVKSALSLPAPAPAGADLRRPGRARAHPAEDQLRRAAARPRRLAPLHDGDQRRTRSCPTATRSPASSTSRGASSATWPERSDLRDRRASRPGWRMQLGLARATVKAIRQMRKIGAARLGDRAMCPTTDRPNPLPRRRARAARAARD